MLEKTKQATANSNNQNLLEYQNEVQKLQQKNGSLNEKVKECTQQLSEQKSFYENLRQDFSNEKKSFNMGRGHESEVRVNDISVSRTHAIITY